MFLFLPTSHGQIPLAHSEQSPLFKPLLSPLLIESRQWGRRDCTGHGKHAHHSFLHACLPFSFPPANLHCSSVNQNLYVIRSIPPFFQLLCIWFPLPWSFLRSFCRPSRVPLLIFFFVLQCRNSNFPLGMKTAPKQGWRAANQGRGSGGIGKRHSARPGPLWLANV